MIICDELPPDPRISDPDLARSGKEAMLALPLRLIGCNIYDANDRWVALLRGEREEYSAHGEQIVADVNSNADLLDTAKEFLLALEPRGASLMIEISRQMRPPRPEISDRYAKLEKSHADLLAAAKELLLALEQTMHARKIGLAGDLKTIEEAETRMQMKAQAAIARAEQV